MSLFKITKKFLKSKNNLNLNLYNNKLFKIATYLILTTQTQSKTPVHQTY